MTPSPDPSLEERDSAWPISSRRSTIGFRRAKPLTLKRLPPNTLAMPTACERYCQHSKS